MLSDHHEAASGGRPARRLSKTAAVELGGLALVAAVLVIIVVLAREGADNRRLRVDVLSPRRAEPDTTVTVTVTARDDEGRAQGADLDFGDGHTDRIRGVTPCASGPTTRTFDFEHDYELPGVYTMRAVVESESCTSDGERSTAIRTIEVKPRRQ